MNTVIIINCICSLCCQLMLCSPCSSWCGCGCASEQMHPHALDSYASGLCARALCNFVNLSVGGCLSYLF